jgi:hypothetical protein
MMATTKLEGGGGAIKPSRYRRSDLRIFTLGLALCALAIMKLNTLYRTQLSSVNSAVRYPSEE